MSCASDRGAAGRPGRGGAGDEGLSQGRAEHPTRLGQCMEASSLREQSELGGWATCLPLRRSARAAGTRASAAHGHPHGPEAGSPRPRCWRSQCLLRPSSCLRMAAFSCVLVWWTGRGGPFSGRSQPTVGVPPTTCSNTAVSPPNAAPAGIWSSTCEFGGHRCAAQNSFRGRPLSPCPAQWVLA